ncbi:cuticlin-1 isoform X3 [Lepeophtheirus salmonis]|uniref:cuticlin-1 isoform X3 n=1 Tax=Lepeophtheirus salmonis TaxID=72036 RepID=UPI003AF40581
MCNPHTSDSYDSHYKVLKVQCEIEMMRVRVIFDRPFRGLIFSKGYYSDRKCIHTPSGLGQTVVTFDISLRSCGMVSSFNNDNHSPQGQYIENTIIIQYDPQLQEVWDQARKLRCTWYDFYEKSVTFQPYRVNTLDPVTANFLGDNLRCWMQIQVGKGPHASEVSGIVKIGQTMTMVLGIKDDENKFDMMIRNCVAHDGLRSPITLVNERGCIVRSKIMSNFKKIKNFDVTANVLAFAYFQAFKFPDSMNVHFQCVVQVCRDYCPDPICSDKTDFQVSDAYESNRGSLLSHRNSNSVINPRSIIEPSNLPGAINNKSTRSLESYRSVDDSKKNCQRN